VAAGAGFATGFVAAGLDAVASVVVAGFAVGVCAFAAAKPKQRAEIASSFFIWKTS
jgi:hypothetical protein